MFLGSVTSEWMGQYINKIQGLPMNSPSPISGIFVAIIIGLLIRNLLGLHDIFVGGVQFSLKFILKLGIILLGIRLSFIDVVKLGAFGIPIILSCILMGLFVTLYITKKMQQSSRLGTLIASGTGICGVTAILAISPSIKATDDEVAYAIANITVFGIIGMFLYPHVAHWLFADDPIRIGLFLGTAIHDTAQVAGASLMYGEMHNADKVVDVATITKLTRNVFIIVVVPVLSYIYLKGKSDDNNEENVKPWYKLIPLFVIGFLIMSMIRSIGDTGILHDGKAFGLMSRERWSETWLLISTVGTKYLLGISMAAVGLSTNLKVFKSLGIKPFYIGMVAAISVGVVSVIMVYLFGGLINI
ncbi:YeiH family protein [Psychrobacillus sp. NPDC096623]|uniref:YeiH family protein n=1 Tax=Psychrobacillus sp. NPDC096623 TaxID=3364492 RepID=UPI00380FFB0C